MSFPLITVTPSFVVYLNIAPQAATEDSGTSPESVTTSDGQTLLLGRQGFIKQADASGVIISRTLKAVTAFIEDPVIASMLAGRLQFLGSKTTFVKGLNEVRDSCLDSVRAVFGVGAGKKFADVGYGNTVDVTGWASADAVEDSNSLNVNLTCVLMYHCPVSSAEDNVAVNVSSMRTALNKKFEGSKCGVHIGVAMDTDLLGMSSHRELLKDMLNNGAEVMLPNRSGCHLDYWNNGQKAADVHTFANTTANLVCML